MRLSTFTDEARLALETLVERAQEIARPGVRLGVTGLSRAGKTVFITALVHNLIHGGRLPMFAPAAAGRIAGAKLDPQPDDAVPRFDYEAHIGALVHDRLWPQSTRMVSELRLTVAYESATFLGRHLGRGSLTVDIVDYPGEWLLDLSLMERDYAQWSAEAIGRLAARPAGEAGAALAAALQATDPAAPESEAEARRLAALFTAHLKARRADPEALAADPPGRFLMPGDLEGSPLLTFAPLMLPPGQAAAAGSLAAMMARRYESYRNHVVRPFFRDHFARLDRQIVLVDVLSALDRGPGAVRELQRVLTEVMAAFRPGRLSFLSGLIDRRIDRILFAATKADHLHHQDHDRLEAILARMVADASARARYAGATVQIAALAAVRATRQALVRQGSERLPAITGVPMAGEVIDGEVYDGQTEIALFPGDLPADPGVVFGLGGEAGLPPGTLRFARFRPPKLEQGPDGLTLVLPHIRLDRALDFLLGDRLA
ncbi:YcjX family protein [Pseudoxanthobacter sp.]|uniref:YcjX family protein n=1 Tax=Pseudoxanthobacter sp. TaxID=1925742 RepID=UPI002FE3F0E4